MVKKIRHYKELWLKYHLDYYFALIIPFIMGTIHLVSCCINFSWFYFNYMLFCYIMLTIRILLRYLEKKDSKNIFLYASIFVLIILIPLAVSFITTIRYRENANLILEVFVYLYALVAFINIIVAIKKLCRIKQKPRKYAIFPTFGLINAMYTLFMMMFTLIITFSIKIDDTMHNLLLTSQGIIIILVIIIFVIFVIIYIMQRIGKLPYEEDRENLE